MPSLFFVCARAGHTETAAGKLLAAVVIRWKGHPRMYRQLWEKRAGI